MIGMRLKNSLKVIIVFVLMIMISPLAQSQVLTDKIVDTAPITLYLEMVNSVRKEGKVNRDDAKRYFNNPTVALFKQRPDFDSLKFINNLTFVYSGVKKDSTLLHQNADYLLMLKYKAYEKEIKKAIADVNKTDINTLVKKRIKPFLDPSFNLDSVSIKYIYLFLDEGNGGFPGYVFNSTLQTAHLKVNDIDLITAHEAYHTIVNSIFMHKFEHIFAKNGNDTLQNQQNLLWYLQIVAEEGIADLIDKPKLNTDTSPLGIEFKKLRINEIENAERRIRQLDSLLSSSESGKLNFLDLSKLLENGGHIPGRYMGLKIQFANLINGYRKFTGNPFRFIYSYNEAVKNSKSPGFSAKSIAYLKMMEEQLLR